jgi:DegV family protein with EDD domain
MPGVRVVTDSACDLPDQTLTELGVTMVPLRIRFGGDELIDRFELSTKEFWARCGSFAGLPETSAPAPGQFDEAFRAAAAAGADCVVCVNLSSRLSATIEAARQAARELEGTIDVRVVDSRSVTLGLGLIVVEAASRAAEGAPVDEVVAAAEAAADAMKVYGVIDTLENLKKGGRIGGAQALLGSMLSIKPVIEVRDGVVEQESKQRTRSRALRYLADKVVAAGPLRRLAVFGADAPDMDALLGLIRSVSPRNPIVMGDIGPVIGTHAGPGALGAAWIADTSP